MSQLGLPLLARTDAASPDEDTGVRIAWAMYGGRPVHIDRFSHLRGHDGDRPALTCLGCGVPVHPVLPPVRRGSGRRQDHFRHLKESPDCWAWHGIGAQLWNAVLHLHRALNEVVGTTHQRRLRVRVWCDPASGPWCQGLPLFRSGCQASTTTPVPTWDRVRLTSHRPGSGDIPAIRLFDGPHEVLQIRLVPADPMVASAPLPAGPVPVVEVHVDEITTPALCVWDPSGTDLLPATRASVPLGGPCARHGRTGTPQ